MKKLSLLLTIFGISISSQAEIGIFPRIIEFGTIAISDSYSPRRSIEITNHNQKKSVKLRLTQDCSNSFRFTNFNCFLELGPRQTCELEVEFEPQRIGYQSCSLRVFENGYLVDQLDISGGGTPPKLDTKKQE